MTVNFIKTPLLSTSERERIQTTIKKNTGDNDVISVEDDNDDDDAKSVWQYDQEIKLNARSEAIITRVIEDKDKTVLISVCSRTSSNTYLYLLLHNFYV